MNRLFNSKKFLGFSVIEVVVSLSVVAVASAIAFPIYSSLKSRAYEQNAMTDGDNLNREIIATIGEYTDFGSTNGTISYSPITKLVTITPGQGATAPAPFALDIDADTTLTGVTYANSKTWCLEVNNSTQSAIYTQDGLSQTLTSCGSSSATDSNHFANPDFETDTSNWSTCYNPGGTPNNITVSTINVNSGGQSLVRTVTGGSGATQMNLCGLLSSAFMADKTYSFSIYVYTNRTHNIGLLLSLNSSTGTTYPGKTISVPANTWTQIAFTQKMPSNLTGLTNIQLVDSPMIGDLMYVDSAQAI